MKSTGKSTNSCSVNRSLGRIEGRNGIEFKIMVVTWNMMGKLPTKKTLEMLLSVQRMMADGYLGTQECETSLLMSFFCRSKDCWEKMLCEYLKDKRYKKVKSQKLHGLHIIAFVKENRQQYISTLKSKKIKTGFYGFIGNKGAVSLNLVIGGQEFLFINNHLPSEHKDCQIRNEHLMQIIEQHMKKRKTQNIIFFGDMNYRLNVSGEQSKSICALNQNKQLSYQYFASKDQLTQQKQLQFFFKLFQQQPITFPPTYKLSTEDNTYDHNRITGWTDRIFYKSAPNSNLHQDEYYSQMFVLGSDHRPVFGQFSVNIDPYIVSTPTDIDIQKMKKCLFF